MSKQQSLNASPSKIGSADKTQHLTKWQTRGVLLLGVSGFGVLIWYHTSLVIGGLFIFAAHKIAKDRYPHPDA